MACDNAITAKSVAMCVLFAASMTLGSLPILLARIFKWNSNSQSNPYVQRLLCVGGGVLLCTTFIHLLPEVAEKIEDMDSMPAKEIQWAELLMCIGFFTMYFVEEVVHYFVHKHHDEGPALARSLSVKRGDNGGEKSKTNSARTTGVEGPITICVDEEKKTFDHTHIVDKHDEHDHANTDNGHANHGHGHSHFAPEDSTMKSLRGLFIVMALSVHELFEGLAVGLESSSKNVWYMFGAVSAHKLVIAFCIGVELVTTGMRTYLVVIYVFVFAIVSPLGIGMGIIVTNEGESSTDLPSVILQGLASGTLLYVVFFEILTSEKKSGLKQYFSVLLGFLIMITIKILAGDD